MSLLPKHKLITIGLVIMLLATPVLFTSSTVFAGTTCGGPTDNPVNTSIDLGCSGTGNPLTDLLFAIIRLLSDGIGVIVILSIIIAGIQYTLSRDNPDSAQKAIGRIQASLIALLIYIFIYAILKFLIPGGFFL